MPDLSAGPWHSPWFDALLHRPARTGWYEYYDAVLDRIVLVRWNRKKSVWEWDETLSRGDKWRGLTLAARIEILERTDFIVSHAVVITKADTRKRRRARRKSVRAMPMTLHSTPSAP